MEPTHSYSYDAILSASERIGWTIDDVLAERDRFDFERPFTPETLAATRALDFLSAAEQRSFNPIRGNAYLCIFGLIEEFILPFVLDHARPLLAGDGQRVRALLGVALAILHIEWMWA